MFEQLFSALSKRGGGLKPRRRKQHKRLFAAAQQDNLTADFLGTYLNANSELLHGLETIRGRSRQLANDNDHFRKFLQLVKSNVVGVNGIVLQSKARQKNGELDRADIKIIEKAWQEWSRKENASMSGRLSWIDQQRVIIETVARDGEVLIQKVKGADNPFGFSLHVMECDRLNILNNQRPQQGNRVTMGVEHDSWGKAHAYHLLSEHPGDTNGAAYGGLQYKSIPASDVIHAFMTERPEQLRGLPWAVTAIRRLNTLGKYEEAELVAARLGASKMGFFTSPDGEGYVPDDESDDLGLISEVEPGIFEQLPEGMGFQAFDPTHPTTAFDAFTAAILRGVSSGLNVAYSSLSNDLTSVNFSSIRSGVIDEQDQWKMIQKWMIEPVCVPVFQEWLKMPITTGALPSPMSRLYKFQAVAWQPRGWQWVDPLKDVKAQVEAIKLGVLSRADVAAAQGKDLDEVFEQLKREEDRAKELGLTIKEEAVPVAESAQNINQKKELKNG